MGSGFYDLIASLLKEKGYKHTGNYKGDHEKWELFDKNGNRISQISVPYNLKGKGTAISILKKAGIKHRI